MFLSLLKLLCLLSLSPESFKHNGKWIFYVCSSEDTKISGKTSGVFHLLGISNQSVVQLVT